LRSGLKSSLPVGNTSGYMRANRPGHLSETAAPRLGRTAADGGGDFVLTVLVKPASFASFLRLALCFSFSESRFTKPGGLLLLERGPPAWRNRKSSISARTGLSMTSQGFKFASTAASTRFRALCCAFLSQAVGALREVAVSEARRCRTEE
jgi:hypothetical protein